MRQNLALSLALLVAWFPLAGFAQDSVEKLAINMPAGANSVMIADLSKIRQSQIAATEGWFESHSAGMESGIGFLPEGTDAVIVASQMNFLSLGPSWTSGFMTFKQAPSLVQVSRQINGTMDSVGDKDIVDTPTDMYVFNFSDSTLGTLAPANRQTLAAWLTSIEKSNTAGVSSYLMDAVTSLGAGNDLVVAFDIANVISPNTVYARAKDSTELQNNGIDAQQFANLLGSIQGVTIGVDITSAINATVNFDFGQDAQMLSKVAKPLLIEIMDNHGLHVAELASWDASINGKQVSLAGQLSKKSLRRLISVFDVAEPHMTATPKPSGGGESAPKELTVGQATKQYFDEVTSMVNDLKQDIGEGGQSLYKYQRWMSSYASKIDNLSMKNVDSDMLDFGAWVAQSFRQINLNITNGHQSVDVQNKNLMAYNANTAGYRYRGYGYGYAGYGYGLNYGAGWGYGYYPWRYNAMATESDKRAIHQQARSSSIDFGASILTAIANREADVRRTMHDKYPNDF